MTHVLSRATANAVVPGPVLAILVLLLVPTAAGAATLTPTTTADQFDLVADAECSLREAVESANLNADFGGCVAAGVYGDDVIELAAATYPLTLGPTEPPFDLDNSVGDLDVEPLDVERLEIRGQGAAETVIERDSLEEFRVLDIVLPALVHLQDLTVRNGLVSDDFGGGIYAEGYELSLERVVVRDNAVVGGGFAVGGGIYTDCEVLSLVDTQVIDNRVDPEGAFFTFDVLGGGIFGFTGYEPAPCECGVVEGAAVERAVVPAAGGLLIEGSTISGNRAMGDADAVADLALGGGAFLVDFSAVSDPAQVGPLRIVNSTFSGNMADAGGGLVIERVSGIGEVIPTVGETSGQLPWRERFGRKARSERAEGGER